MRLFPSGGKGRKCGTNKLSHQRPHCEQVVYPVENGRNEQTKNELKKKQNNPIRIKYIVRP